MRFIPTIQDRKLQELLCRSPPPPRFPSAISRLPALAASRSRVPASMGLGEGGRPDSCLTWLEEPRCRAKERVLNPVCVRETPRVSHRVPRSHIA